MNLPNTNNTDVDLAIIIVTAPIWITWFALLIISGYISDMVAKAGGPGA